MTTDSGGLAVHHIHIRTADAEASYRWWSEAFGLTKISDETRVTGERFVKCESVNAVPVFFSTPQTGEEVSAADVRTRFGLDHFGFASSDVSADVDRLLALGAELIAGPIVLADGRLIAFLATPDGCKVELVTAG